MKIKSFDGHSFCPDIIEQNGWVLDLGCRNFVFSTQMAVEYNVNVISVDACPDLEIPSKLDSRIRVVNKAVITDHRKKTIEYSMFDDWGANTVRSDVSLKGLNKKGTVKVPCITIKNIMKEYNIEQFELIKMDIEGMEYAILQGLKVPIAKQFSVEFHDWIAGMNPYEQPRDFYKSILESSMQEYSVVFKDYVEHCGGHTYRDMVFVHRKYVT